jgi:hypothetical protein
LTAIAMAATANGSSIRYTRHRFTASRFLFFPSKETFFFLFITILSDYIFFSTLIWVVPATLFITRSKRGIARNF